MTSREALEQAVAELHDARNKRDLEDTMKRVHPECHFRIVGTDSLRPLTQPASNYDEIHGAARSLFEVWDLSGLQNVSLHTDGDTAFVQRAGRIRFLPSETTFETEVMEKITFRDGLVVEYLQFVDTYQLAQIAGIGRI